MQTLTKSEKISLSTTEIAKLIRQQLKKEFKGSEYLIIKTSHEEITFSVHSYGEVNESTSLEKYNDNILEHKVEKESKAIYKILLLTDFIKEAVKISEAVTIKFSDDMPVILDVELPRGEMIYYLAPCIGV